MQATTAEGLNAKPNRMGVFGPTPKGRVTSKKTLIKSNMDADRLTATAVAAGARIVSQSDAELLKVAAQAKNTIHIMPQTGGSMKSSTVHQIRSGTKQPGSSKTLPRPSQQALKIDTSRKITGVISTPDAEVLAKQVQTGVESGSGQVQEGKMESPKQKVASVIALTNAQDPAGSLDTKKDGANDKAVIGEERQVGIGEGDDQSVANGGD